MKSERILFLMAVFTICLFSLCKPKYSATKTVTTEHQKQDTLHAETKLEVPAEPIKTEYKIGFMMPFAIEENLQLPASDLDEQELISNTIPAIEFYEGAKMAVDSFKNTAININLEIFDPADSTKLESLMNSNKIFKTDLLFLNLPTANLTGILKKSLKTNTQIVYTKSAAIKNENLITILPNNQTMINEMADYLARHFTNENIIVVYRDVKKENELGEWFAARIDSSHEKKSVNNIKCSRLNYTTEKLDGLIKKLDKTKKNLLVITSSDEAFISPLLNQLIEKTEMYKIHICGMPTWENFETVSVKSLEQLETLIFSANYIDYDDPELQLFRKEFIKVYYSDPQLAAFQGFFMMKGYLKAMIDDRKNWNDIAKAPNNFNNALFEFTNGAMNTGFENTHISVLKFSDYKLRLQPD